MTKADKTHDMQSPNCLVSCPQQCSEDEKYDPEEMDAGIGIGQDFMGHLPHILFLPKRFAWDGDEGEK
jgi:hypothetical protein